jgi:hypothetical protein
MHQRGNTFLSRRSRLSKRPHAVTNEEENILNFTCLMSYSTSLYHPANMPIFTKLSGAGALLGYNAVIPVETTGETSVGLPIYHSTPFSLPEVSNCCSYRHENIKSGGISTVAVYWRWLESIKSYYSYGYTNHILWVFLTSRNLRSRTSNLQICRPQLVSQINKSLWFKHCSTTQRFVNRLTEHADMQGS